MQIVNGKVKIDVIGEIRILACKHAFEFKVSKETFESHFKQTAHSLKDNGLYLVTLPITKGYIV